MPPDSLTATVARNGVAPATIASLIWSRYRDDTAP